MATSTIQHRTSALVTDEGVPTGIPASAFVLGNLDLEGRPTTALPLTMRFSGGAGLGSARVQLYVRAPDGTWSAAGPSRQARHAQRILVAFDPMTSPRYASIRVTGASSSWALTVEAAEATTASDEDRPTGDASSRLVWYVKATTGSDSGDGSAERPLKTAKQWARMVKGSRFSDHLFLNIPEGLPVSDPLQIDDLLPGVAGEIHVIGARTQVATGVLDTAVVAIDRTGSATHQQITVTDFDWAPHVNRMVRITSGARAGATAWVESTPSLGVAIVSGFQQTVYGAPGTTSWSTLTLVTPVVGDPIEVVTLADVAEAPRVHLGPSTTPSARVTFEDIRFSKATTTVGAGILSSSCRLIRCDVVNIETGGSSWVIFHNSRVAAASCAGRFDIRGGLVTGIVDHGTSYGPCLVGFDALIGPAGRFTTGTFLGGLIQFGNVGVRALTGVLCTQGVGRSAQLTGGVIYGTTTNQVLFDLTAGARLFYATATIPTANTGTAKCVNLRGGMVGIASGTPEAGETLMDGATAYTNPANGAQLLPEVA